MKLHIFDVDFTIVRCSTVREFLVRGLRTGLVGLSLGFYAPMLFFHYRFSGSKGRHVERAYPFLKGVQRLALEKLAEAVFAERILPSIDPVVAARIAAMQKAGDKVMIASSSFGILLAPLARHLGITELVASELEFENGVSTGRVEGEPAFGEGKRSRIVAYLEERGIKPGDCAFYSDSNHDLPLLRTVGKPVAVNPDKKLRRVAHNEGWELMYTNRGAS